MNRLFSTSNTSLGKYNIFQSISTNIDTIIFSDMIEGNPLTRQGIKINHKTYRLIFFEQSPTNLTFIFDKDTILKFYFRDVIIMQLICPKFKINESKLWVPSRNIIVWKEEFKELNYISAISVNK